MSPSHSSRRIENDVAVVSEIVGPEFAELVSPVMRELSIDPHFGRGREIYELIEREYQKGGDYARRVDIDLVRREFQIFAQAHVLFASGQRPYEAAAALGDPRIEQWFANERIPHALQQADPNKGRNRVIPVSAPLEESPEFAYLLGAYAGNRQRSAKSVQVSFQSLDGQTIEALVEATKASTGIELGVRRAVVGPHAYFSACSRAREFAEVLADLSRRNTVVPWTHVQTSAERQKFLTGFFDFCGGSVDAAAHRLTVARSDNAGLLREVALVLMREGIYPRVSGAGSPTLYIDALVDLRRLDTLGIVRSPDLRVGLKDLISRHAEIPSTGVEAYDVVRGVRNEKGSAEFSPAAIRKALKRTDSPFGGIEEQVIRRWVTGENVTPSARRRDELLDIESKSISFARLESFGKKIVARIGKDLHPAAVVAAIAEFYGGFEALSLRSGMRSDELRAFAVRERIPSRAEYRLILDTVGLDLTGKLEECGSPPDFKKVKSWLSPRQSEVFMSYLHPIMQKVSEAFAAGRDPRALVLEEVARLAQRNARMIVEEGPRWSEGRRYREPR